MNDIYYAYEGIRYYDHTISHLEDGGRFEWSETVRFLYPNRHQRKHMDIMKNIANRHYLDGVAA